MKDQQPTNHQIGIIFQCNLYISCIMSCGNKICFKLFQFKLKHNGYTANEGNQQYQKRYTLL